MRTRACENDELAVLKGESVLGEYRVLKWRRTARSEQPRVGAVDGLGVSRPTPILQQMEKACLRYIWRPVVSALLRRSMESLSRSKAGSIW